jgi:hypothetical protein
LRNSAARREVARWRYSPRRSNAAHENYPDGSFLTLYTWLRIEKAFDSTKSYRLAKSLMKDHFFKASLKTNPNDRKIVLLNVEDANLV